jgi:2-amino-4-hydroxy-6-hydroxymethyldihydropteridine diphosphokinase
MTAAIALGSNLTSRYGPPEANLREALHRLADLGTLTAVSTFHATNPVGYLDQPQFLNAAALLETNLDPLTLLRALLAIEHTMGRDRTSTPPKGPRIIDLDLLLYMHGGAIGYMQEGAVGEGHAEILHDPDLTLPHPAMHLRRFVLAPLAEIAPNLQHPTLHRSIADLLATLPT